MVNFTKREQIVILIFVIVIVCFFGYHILNNNNIEIIKADVSEENADNIKSYINETYSNETDTDKSKPNIIAVHIDGEVKNPGVVEIEEGARVIDVINTAGGLTQYADEKKINLAKRVYDEEKIYIPKIGEIDPEIEMNSYINESSDYQRKININTASKEELEELSGIGPALAERIIEYRKKNKFETIEDIKKVSGIGDKKFEAIKEYITVR